MNPAFAKQQSHEYLTKHKIPINESLPFIEDPSRLNPVTSIDAARRAVVLTYIVGVGFGEQGAELKKALEGFNLLQYASAEEQLLLSIAQPTKLQMMNATWLVECIQALGWCFSLVANDPFRQCDDDLASHFPPPFSEPSNFILAARLRPFPDLYCQADLYYRLHWAAVDCRLRQVPSPVNEGIIRERRKALDWIIGVESNWDAIPMDT